MSITSTASLLYGIVWDGETDILYPEDEQDLAEDDDLEWMDVVLDQRGIESPFLSFRSPEDIPDEETSAYFTAKREIQNEYGVDIDYGYWDDRGYPHIFVVASRRVAYVSGPQALDPATLVVDPSWDGMLSRFISDVGIEVDRGEFGPSARGPGWLLIARVSY